MICQFVFSLLCFHFVRVYSGFCRWSRLGIYRWSRLENKEYHCRRTNNIQPPQIDFFITHTYYECAYGLEDYRFHHLHKSLYLKRLSCSVFSEAIVQDSDISEIAYYVVEHKRRSGLYL